MSPRKFQNAATYHAWRLVERDWGTWIEFTAELLTLAPRNMVREWAIQRLSAAIRIRLKDLGARDPGDEGLFEMAAEIVDTVLVGGR